MQIGLNRAECGFHSHCGASSGYDRNIQFRARRKEAITICQQIIRPLVAPSMCYKTLPPPSTFTISFHTSRILPLKFIPTATGGDRFVELPETFALFVLCA